MILLTVWELLGMVKSEARAYQHIPQQHKKQNHKLDLQDIYNVKIILLFMQGI